MTEVFGRDPEPTVKQPLLCVPVVLHRLVIVEMVAREISEDRDRVFELITTMKIHRLRRTFHHRRTATNLDCLAQQSLHVRRFRRGAIRFVAAPLPRRYSTVPVIATGSPAASGIEAIEISGGRFAVCPGDADRVVSSRDG